MAFSLFHGFYLTLTLLIPIELVHNSQVSPTALRAHRVQSWSESWELLLRLMLLLHEAILILMINKGLWVASLRSIR